MPSRSVGPTRIPPAVSPNFTNDCYSPLVSRFEGSTLEVDRTVVYGKPAEEIVRFAVDKQVDLIVLASHQIDLSRLGHGWGTLSYKIGVLAPCPVLLVK